MCPMSRVLTWVLYSSGNKRTQPMLTLPIPMPTDTPALERLLNAGVLVTLRIGGLIVAAPVFSSPGFPVKAKVVFTIAIAILMAPVAAALPQTRIVLDPGALLGEATVGLLMGLTLTLMNETLLFAASMMSVSFSFSLANLLDPNSQVETEVLGTVLSWMGILVLLGAGLHRTVLAAVFRTFATVPLGTAATSAVAGKNLAFAASGIFLAGMQLAAPVVAAAMLVEVAIGLVSRMAPALPAQVASVPLKSLVSFVTLIASLALWPGWIDHHFSLLLDSAQKAVRP